MPRTFVLANHFWCHSVFELFLVKLLIEFALPVSVNQHFDFLQAFLEDGFTDIGKEANYVLEVDGLVL